MNWNELYEWVSDVEDLTGGHVEIRTHGGLLEVSVNWCVGDRRYVHREAFTPIEMVEAHGNLIRSRLDAVTNKIRRYVEAPK